MIARADIPQKPVIYVVDDDQGIRRALSTLLGTIGYDAVTFASPTEFLYQYDPNRPSCLLLDLQMPGMNGLEVQRQLVRSGSLLPIIFMSGQGDIRTAVHATKNGAIGFLEKPFSNEELVDLIRRALDTDAKNRQLFSVPPLPSKNRIT